MHKLGLGRYCTKPIQYISRYLWFDTIQIMTLQLNENMKKSSKFIQIVDVLLYVQSDFIIFQMSIAQFTNYSSLIRVLYSIFVINR